MTRSATRTPVRRRREEPIAAARTVGQGFLGRRATPKGLNGSKGPKGPKGPRDLARSLGQAR